MGNWVYVSGSRGRTSRHGTGGRRKATHGIPRVPASCGAWADRSGGRLSCPSRQHCAREQREPVRDPAPQIPARATEPATNHGPGRHRRSPGTVYFDALFLQQVCPQRQLYPMNGWRIAVPAARGRGCRATDSGDVGGALEQKICLDAGCVAFRKCAVKDAPPSCCWSQEAARINLHTTS